MSTTQNCDLLAEVREAVPTEIVQAFWVAGRLPTYLHAPAVLQGTPFANVEVFTTPPYVSIAADLHAPGLIGIFRQPMVIRTDTVRGEITNTLEVRLPLSLVETKIDGVELQLLELDLTQADLTNTTLTNPQNAIAEVIVAWLAGLVGPIRIPITPPLLPSVRFFPTARSTPSSGT